MRNVENFLGATLALVLLMAATSESAGPAACTYRNAEDETVFLSYYPLLRKGEDYVDFGKEGTCLKRATCTDTFKTIVEDCAKHRINCQNKHRFTGVFPACCVKCP